jgi:hypothetical protein
VPWIEVDEPFARPPRLRPVRPGRHWVEPLDVDRGWAELAEVEVGASAGLDLSGCDELEIRDCRLEGLALAPDAGLSITLHRSELVNCDLSRVRCKAMRSSSISACKLIGAELSGATISDVRFEQCTFRYASLRMATLSRVELRDCVVDEVDAYDLRAEDVALPGTRLVATNLDRLQAERFDLREAAEISLSVVNRLAGCLVAEHQLWALAETLAHAAGVAIERPATGGG